MVGVEINELLIQNQKEALAALFLNEPQTRERIRKIVREELKDARKRVQEDATFEIKDDPRKAYKAIKFSVYKKIMGGNISILARRKAGSRYQLIRPSAAKDPNWRFKRGGNRRKRNSTTERLDTYFGADRGFVLRFLNSGAKKNGGDRHIKFTPDPRRDNYDDNKHPNTGRRGNIAARGWFANMGQRELEIAAMNLGEVIEEELADIFRDINKL